MDNNIKDLIKEFSLKHIAIIMDGNGRWAKSKNLKRTDGHNKGMDKVVEIVETCAKLNLDYLSLYAFSTENWKRPELEVKTIFNILNIFIKNELNRLLDNNVKVVVMGDISKLPFQSKKLVEYAINKTKNNTGLILNIGINYGSRSEISMGIKSLLKDYKENNIDIDDIDELTLSKYLYTKEIPDPDLLIRTGGEKRLSNFMLYQMAYTEFYFTDILWPDFGKKELEEAIFDYLRRDRRFGGLNE